MTAFYGGVTGSLPVAIGSPSIRLRLICVSSIISRLVKTLANSRRHSKSFYCIPTSRQVALNKVMSLLRSFQQVARALRVPSAAGSNFTGGLCSACLSCLPTSQFTCSLGVGASPQKDFARVVHATSEKRFSIGISGPNVAGNRR